MAFTLKNMFGSPPDEPNPPNATPAARSGENAKDSSDFLFRTAPSANTASKQPMPVTRSQPESASNEEWVLCWEDFISQIPNDVVTRDPVSYNEPLPLDLERIIEQLSQGKTTLSLQELYRAFPRGFSKEIDPNDGRSVSLPPSKLVHLVGRLKKRSTPRPSESMHAPLDPPEVANEATALTSSFSHLPPPSVSNQNPFKIVPKRRTGFESIAAKSAEPSSSPFSMVGNETGTKSPFTPVAPASRGSQAREAPLVSAPKNPDPAVSSFQAVSPPATEDLFSLTQLSSESAPVNPAPSPFTAVQAPTPKVTPENASSQEPIVELPLQSLLSPCSVDDLGFDPSQLPAHIQARIPVSVLRRKLHQGSPSFTLEQLSHHVSGDYGNMLQHGNPSTLIEVPVNLLYHQLAQHQESRPGVAATREVAFTPAAVASTLEAFPMIEEAMNEELPAPAPEAPTQTNLADVLRARLQTKRLPEPTEPPPSAPSPFQMVSEPQASDPGLAPPIDELAKTSTSWELEPLVTPEPAYLEAEKSVNSAPPQFLEAPNLKRPTFNVAQRVPNTSTKRVSKQQLLWKVLFGVNQDIEIPQLLDLLRQRHALPAIAIIRDGQLAYQSSAPSLAAEAFLQQAPKIVEHLQAVVQITGSQDSESFSFKHNDLENTFLVQDHHTFALMHPPTVDVPAWKDEITLVARELDEMFH